MGGDAMFDDNGAAEIAAEWGVSADLLNEAVWEPEPLEGNEGEEYGYFVRFAEDTDPKLLRALGVPRGKFVREVSVNAFDKPEE